MAIIGHVDNMEGCYALGWAMAQPDSGNCTISITDSQGELLAKGRAARHRADLAVLGLGRTTLGFRIPVPHADTPRRLHIWANNEPVPGSPLQTGPGLYDGQASLEADYITGWVTERRPGFTPPFITVRNHLGVEVGRGQSQFDDDMSDPLFTPARFSIRLDDCCFGAGEMPLHVFADGVPFASTVCNLALTGNLEVISATRCQGWLFSPDVPERAFEIEIFRDGEAAATALCDQAREDVRAVHPDCATPGFAATLEAPPDPAFYAMTLSLRLAGSQRDLFEGPYKLASRAATIHAAHKAARLAHQDLPDLGPTERAVLTQALGDYLTRMRVEDGITLTRQMRSALPDAPALPRVAIIIPIYRGVEITRACIESVLAHRNPQTDRLILINDASPDAQMAGMLLPYALRENVLLLTNPENFGFVRTVNRGLGLAPDMDVLLLNADTVLHTGGLDELLRVAHAAPEIGTVTALSNNATIFSYPHASLRHPELDDMSWPELAALALAHNAGLTADVPTGHGFCMLIKAALIRRIGHLDEAFGRGYGEENDFCARAADLGYRNVAAGGVLVEHKESISFENERASLLAQNLPRLNALYPEYTPLIMAFEREDGLRALRWALDRARLERARTAGQTFVLIVANALEGGTPRAIDDIERHAGYGGAIPLTLRVSEDGLMELECQTPLLRASFLETEYAALFELLDAANPSLVLLHQLLGFGAGFVEALIPWLAGRTSLYWAHDFYPLCPRVTMIDAIGRFCGGADDATCARCVEMEGAHETSRLTALTPAEHRALFARLLGAASHVLAPSDDAARHLSRIFADIAVDVLPHPESGADAPNGPRTGTDDEIVLLGAIGPHKGSHLLLEIARRARLTHPNLHFRVIGYTDIDTTLRAVGNVAITGKYAPEDLPELLAQTRGRLALFLPNWPETYSYTLSELVLHGFIPLVPDIGAPAERVRAARYGVVFPFPASAETVLATIDEIASGKRPAFTRGGAPKRFFSKPEEFTRLCALLAPAHASLAGAAD